MLYRWFFLTDPIVLGSRSVFVLSSLTISADAFSGEPIPVPMYRDSFPIFVAVDSSLPAGYDAVYDYSDSMVRIYRYDNASDEWVQADSIPQDFEFRVLMIYEVIGRGGAS